MAGMAGIGFPRIISDLDSHLRSGEKKREVLENLLTSGRISRDTFDLIEKKIRRLTSIVLDLKETLEKEESFRKGIFLEETRILESLLIELELSRLLGEIGEEEWTQKNKILSLGLDSLKTGRTLTNRNEQEPVLPIQTKLEEHASERIVTKLEIEDKRDCSQEVIESNRDMKHIVEEGGFSKHSLHRNKRWLTKEPPELEGSLVSGVHCMNPWNTECRNTDIKLSIYYDGRMIPICRRCWEDISKNNIEWSSL